MIKAPGYGHKVGTMRKMVLVFLLGCATEEDVSNRMNVCLDPPPAEFEGCAVSDAKYPHRYCQATFELNGVLGCCFQEFYYECR